MNNLVIHLNSKERVLTTLNHEEPDRVPIYTSVIDSKAVLDGYENGGMGLGNLIRKAVRIVKRFPFRSRFFKYVFNKRMIHRLGIKRTIKLYQEIGLDLFVVPTCMLPVGKSAAFGVKLPGMKLPKWSTFVDEYGRTFSIYNINPQDASIYIYIGGIFQPETGGLEEAMEKYEKWTPLDADIKSRYYAYEEASKLAEGTSPYIIPGIAGFFESTWEGFGFETFSGLLYEHPDFLEEVMKNNEEFARAVVENLIERYDIEAFWIFDDYGEKTRPFLSPKQFQRLITPRMKRLINFCHKKGVKVLLHSCGNLNKILDQLIDAGIDGLNPLEPSAAMDPFQIKRDYGDRITIIGNVDIIHLLAKGTPKQVEEYVKKLIRECAPGGGFIVSSGHSINPQVPFKNYDAMVKATFKYGSYPISFKD